MMTKAEALEWFKKIQNGAGVNRTEFPDRIKGRVAAKMWDEMEFSLGVEYGVLIALMKAFDITLEDLGWSDEEIGRNTIDDR